MSQVTEAQLAVRKANKSELHKARTSRTMKQRSYDSELMKHGRLTEKQKTKHLPILEEKRLNLEEAEQLVEELESKAL